MMCLVVVLTVRVLWQLHHLMEFAPSPQGLAPHSCVDTTICESDQAIFYNFTGFSPSKITKQALVGVFFQFNLDPSDSVYSKKLLYNQIIARQFGEGEGGLQKKDRTIRISIFVFTQPSSLSHCVPLNMAMQVSSSSAATHMIKALSLLEELSSASTVGAIKGMQNTTLYTNQE